MTVMTVVCTIVSISIRVYDFESTVIPYEYWSLLVVAVAIDSYYVCVCCWLLDWNMLMLLL